MNYKKLKRVLALSLAVLLSVPTSVYGGAMEVHAAEEQELSAEESSEVQQAADEETIVSDDETKEVNDNLSGNEVIDDLSSGEEQGEQPSSNDEEKEETEEQDPEEKKEAQDTVENEEQEEVQDTTAQDEQQEAAVEEAAQDEEKAVVLEAKKDAPTEVENCEASSLPDTLVLGFEDTQWMNAINLIKVGDITFTKVSSLGWFDDGDNFCIGSYVGGYGDYTALKIIKKKITFPATMVISADGYEDLTLKVTKETIKYTDVYTAEVVTDTNPDVPVDQTYTVTTSECANGTLAVDPSTGVTEGTEVKVTAAPNEGYEVESVTAAQADDTEVALTEDTENAGVYTFTMPASNVTVSATFKVAALRKIALSQLELTQDMFGQDWILKFKNADGYVAAVTDVKVNGTSWEAKSYGVSSGGAYKKDVDENTLTFAAKDFSSSSVIPVLKSGDVITITAKGYDDLTFKLIIDKDGNPSLVEDDGEGDIYELHVKIEGSFEAAIVGQKDYDGVSSASVGGSSSNKNSSVTVYGALEKKNTDQADFDWEELDNLSKIKLDGSKCIVSIVPDVENGTAEGSDSGMEGVYMTISSALTLNGTPKDKGTYLISVSVADDQGRTATSNTLPFRIYDGEETLAEQIQTENLKQYESGLYAWDIMEPWAIKNFGSNVEGQEESVRVPADLEAWFGSHESGTYGYLGYDIPWAQVEAGNIPQTLYIPDGCNLTLTNMEILSSVRIVVENGGKLTLSDSVVQGIIDVQNGGTFSMNYDSYNNAFTTGASLCGQLRLGDGAILENAAIYSHINYLANGDLTDRNSDEAVVVATGNVTLKGQVFIEGDSAGGSKGQAALKVKDGTLTLEDGATLVAYGGDGKVLLFSEGGDAIQLDNGTIAGNGKVAAIGGDVLWGPGGNAVSGNGAIRTTEAFLQGATANTSNKATPGKAVDGNITITSEKRYVANGTLISGAENDPLADLYWKTGIDPVPPLDKFTTGETQSFTVADIPSQVYTGEELQPQIVVTDGEKTLTEGTDYEVTYKQTRRAAAAMIDAGTYTVVVSGIGVYGGSVEKTFVIDPKKMTFAVTEDVASAVYDGQNKRPVVTVKDGDTVLTEGIDYTIAVSVDGKEYTDAEFVAAGVYQMTITGIGNYEGSTGKVSFTISEKSSDQNNNGNNVNNGSTTDNGNNANNTNNNSTKKKKHSSHSHASEEETAVQSTAAENTAATDVNAVPATGDMAQTEQWMLLSAVSLAAIGIFLENKRKKKNEN